MRPIQRSHTLFPAGRPRWAKAKTVDELIERITPFVGYIDACAFDEVALELEAALTGDDPEDESSVLAGEFLPGPEPGDAAEVIEHDWADGIRDARHMLDHPSSPLGGDAVALRRATFPARAAAARTLLGAADAPKAAPGDAAVLREAMYGVCLPKANHGEAMRDAEFILRTERGPLGRSEVARNLARCYLDHVERLDRASRRGDAPTPDPAPAFDPECPCRDDHTSWCPIYNVDGTRKVTDPAPSRDGSKAPTVVVNDRGHVVRAAPDPS